MKKNIVLSTIFVIGCGSNWVPCEDMEKPTVVLHVPDMSAPVCVTCCPLMRPDMTAPLEPCGWDDKDGDDNDKCECKKEGHGKGKGHCEHRNKHHSHNHGNGNCKYDCED